MPPGARAKVSLQGANVDEIVSGTNFHEGVNLTKSRLLHRYFDWPQTAAQAAQLTFGGGALFEHNLLANALQASYTLRCNFVGPGRAADCANTSPISSFTQRRSFSLQVFQIKSAQVPPQPCPEFLNGIQVGRACWHRPKVHLRFRVCFARLRRAQKTLVVAQDVPWTSLIERLHIFDGFGELTFSYCAGPLVLGDLLVRVEGDDGEATFSVDVWPSPIA